MDVSHEISLNRIFISNWNPIETLANSYLKCVLIHHASCDISSWCWWNMWRQRLRLLESGQVIYRVSMPPTSLNPMMTSSNGNFFAFTDRRWIPPQRPGTRMFSLNCAWTNGWVNNRDTGDLRRHRTHYDVSVMGRETVAFTTSAKRGYTWQYISSHFSNKIKISWLYGHYSYVLGKPYHTQLSHISKASSEYLLWLFEKQNHWNLYDIPSPEIIAVKWIITTC